VNVDDYIKYGILRVIAKPNSPETKVLGYDEGKQAVKMAVAAPPEKGKANFELAKFLSKKLGKEVKLMSGATARLKVFRVS